MEKAVSARLMSTGIQRLTEVNEWIHWVSIMFAMLWDSMQDAPRCWFPTGGQEFILSHFLELQLILTPPRFLCFNSGDKWYTSQNDHFWSVSEDTILQWFQSKWGNKNMFCLNLLRYEMMIIWPSLSLADLYQQPPNQSPSLRIPLQSIFYVTRMIFLKYKCYQLILFIKNVVWLTSVIRKKKILPVARQNDIRRRSGVWGLDKSTWSLIGYLTLCNLLYLSELNFF